MKFSVAIPAFKSKYLSEAIQSVLDQTYGDFEIIIVDDCSPEDLYSVVSSFDDKRIHYYRNEKNCGAVDVVDNWNICLNYCSGDFVICMGDDDRLLSNCLDDYNKLITKYPDLNIYHAWTELIDENSNPFGLQEARPEYESVYSLIWHRWNGRGNQFIGDFLYRLAALRQLGGFYKLPMAWASDDISAVRAAATKGIANTQTLCFQYRVNSLTISSSGNADIKIDAINKEISWYNSFLKNEPTDSTDKKFYSLIVRDKEKHYNSRFRDTLRQDFKSHPGHIIKWICNNSQIRQSRLNVIITWLQSLR